MGGATCRHTSKEDSLVRLLEENLWMGNCGGVARTDDTRGIVISIRRRMTKYSNLPGHAENPGNFCLPILCTDS